MNISNVFVTFNFEFAQHQQPPQGYNFPPPGSSGNFNQVPPPPPDERTPEHNMHNVGTQNRGKGNFRGNSRGRGGHHGGNRSSQYNSSNQYENPREMQQKQGNSGQFVSIKLKNKVYFG